jgi:hypothetical protein
MKPTGTRTHTIHTESTWVPMVHLHTIPSIRFWATFQCNQSLGDFMRESVLSVLSKQNHGKNPRSHDDALKQIFLHFMWEKVNYMSPSWENHVQDPSRSKISKTWTKKLPPPERTFMDRRTIGSCFGLFVDLRVQIVGNSACWHSGKFRCCWRDECSPHQSGE